MNLTQNNKIIVEEFEFIYYALIQPKFNMRYNDI